MGLCWSPLLQLGGLSHILTSEHSRGIWISLQESVGKQALCNYKPSKFSCSSKWKMLVILPLRRSDGFGEPWVCSAPICSAASPSMGSWGHLLPLASWQGWCHDRDTCQPCPCTCPRGCSVSSTIAGDTAPLQLPWWVGQGREATAAELRSSPQINE